MKVILPDTRCVHRLNGVLQLLENRPSFTFWAALGRALEKQTRDASRSTFLVFILCCSSMLIPSPKIRPSCNKHSETVTPAYYVFFMSSSPRLQYIPTLSTPLLNKGSVSPISDTTIETNFVNLNLQPRNHPHSPCSLDLRVPLPDSHVHSSNRIDLLRLPLQFHHLLTYLPCIKRHQQPRHRRRYQRLSCYLERAGYGQVRSITPEKRGETRSKCAGNDGNEG